MLHRFVMVMAITLALSSHLLAQDPARELLDGKRTIFSTKDHPKAKGVHLTIAYPNSWIAQEGDHPNVVQKFRSEGGRGGELVLITIKSVPPAIRGAMTEPVIKEILADGMKEMVPEGAKLISARPTKLEALPAGIVEYSMRRERAGIVVYMDSINYIFFYKDALVSVQCTVGGGSGSEEEISRRMNACRPLFSLMANSVILPDKWTVAPEMPINTIATQTDSDAAVISLEEFKAGNTQRYSTKGNEKAKGVELTMRYPKSWIARDGDRPNVVQKFLCVDGDALVSCMIMVLHAEGGAAIDKKNPKIPDPADLKDSLPPGCKFLGGSKTKIDSLPVCQIEYFQVLEQMGFKVRSHNSVYTIYYENKLIQILCTAGGLDMSEQDAKKCFGKFEDVFRLMVNSVVIQNQWK